MPAVSGGLSLWLHNRSGDILMNKLSIHNITGITIEREVFQRSEEGMDFTVVNITATDDTGRSTRLTCFMKPSFTIDLAGSPLHFECDQCGKADAA